MTSSRVRFAATVADAAHAVAAALGTHQLQGGERYPISELLALLARQHQTLQRAVDAYPGPLAVDAAGQPDPLVKDLAGLMSSLQLLRVLYHGLDDLPASLRTNASKNLSATHLAARRVRDKARRLAR